MKRYQKVLKLATDKKPLVQMSLDQLVLAGAQQLIIQALHQEIDQYLGRKRYEHHSAGETKQYRNGYGKPRNLTAGCGSFQVQVPRLREPFESQIVDHYQRRTEQIERLFPQLYLHGLSTGDFQECFELILGPEAPLSAASIVRLKQHWQQEYEDWKKRPLEADYLYVWADGVYPEAGPKDEQMAVLVVIGLNSKGEKQVLAIEEGYRESAESWRGLLRDLKKRGVRWMGLVIGDGSLGLWAALRDVFPHTYRQRCWIHKMRNILDKVPQKIHDEVLEALRAIYYAGSKAEALKLKRAFVQRYGKAYPKAVASLQEAGNDLFTYFQFPKEHWKSIKSTNVIESMFSAVKLRTNAARRIPKRESALYLVFKLLMSRQQRLNKIHAYRLVSQIIEQLKPVNQSKLRIAA